VYKIRDETESYWDNDKFVVRKFIKRISEGNWKQYRIHYYFPEDTTYYYVTYKKGGQTKKQSTSLADPQDTYTIIYWVRLQEFIVGDTLNLNISLDGDNHPVKLLVEKKRSSLQFLARKNVIRSRYYTKGIYKKIFYCDGYLGHR